MDLGQQENRLENNLDNIDDSFECNGDTLTAMLPDSNTVEDDMIHHKGGFNMFPNIETFPATITTSNYNDNTQEVKLQVKISDSDGSYDCEVKVPKVLINSLHDVLWLLDEILKRRT